MAGMKKKRMTTQNRQKSNAKNSALNCYESDTYNQVKLIGVYGSIPSLVYELRERLAKGFPMELKFPGKRLLDLYFETFNENALVLHCLRDDFFRDRQQFCLIMFYTKGVSLNECSEKDYRRYHS